MKKHNKRQRREQSTQSKPGPIIKSVVKPDQLQQVAGGSESGDPHFPD